MRFKVLSVGRNVSRWAVDTLESVKHPDIDVHVVVDHSKDDSAQVVSEWMAANAGKADSLTICDERRYAVLNQRTALAEADPADDDVIVWVDLDGDRLLPGAVERIRAEYEAGMLLTYGTHICVPPMPGNRVAIPYPRDVIDANSYRHNIMRAGAGFNHPRTMSGAVAKAITDDQFHFADGKRKGEPYDCGTDYVFMIPGLELAGPRHAWIPDPLLAYNHDNPEADYLANPDRTRAVFADLIARPCLDPLGTVTPDHRALLASLDRLVIAGVDPRDGRDRGPLRTDLGSRPRTFWLGGNVRVDLMVALAHGYERGVPHVILIPDARTFAGQPSNRERTAWADRPALSWIVAQAEVAGWGCEIVDDVIRLEKR